MRCRSVPQEPRLPRRTRYSSQRRRTVGSAEPDGRGEDCLVQSRGQSRLIAENRGQSDDRESLSYEKPIKPLERQGASRVSGIAKIGGQRGNRTPTAKGG